MEFILNWKFGLINLEVYLQEYLNWFTYIFIMKKRFNLNKLKTESYSNIIVDNNYINANKIFSMKMPVDLNIAYAEYAN